MVEIFLGDETEDCVKTYGSGRVFRTANGRKSVRKNRKDMLIL